MDTLLRCETSANLYELYDDKIHIIKKKISIWDRQFSFKKTPTDTTEYVYLCDIASVNKNGLNIDLIMKNNTVVSLLGIGVNKSDMEHWLDYLTNPNKDHTAEYKDTSTNYGDATEKAKMFCVECGALIDSNALYCKVCGATVIIDESDTSKSVFVKKKASKVKVIAATVILSFCAVVFGAYIFYEFSGKSNVIIEVDTDEYELGAVFNLTPSELIERYNECISSYNIEGGETMFLPDLNKWESRSTENGKIYYCGINEVLGFDIITNNTHGNNVAMVLCTSLVDSVDIDAVAYITSLNLEYAAAGIYDENERNNMKNIIDEKALQEGYGIFAYNNSVMTINGKTIYISSASDEVIDTLSNCYMISDDDIK